MVPLPWLEGWFCLFLLVMPLGCAGTADELVSPDASVVTGGDSGAVDAGVFNSGQVDASVPGDGGAMGRADAGSPNADAGQRPDAGPTFDAGHAFDAGQPFDAGQAFDAGHPFDAGLAQDAGGPGPGDGGGAPDAATSVPDSGTSSADAGSGGAWSPTYALPAPGHARALGASNVAADVRPSDLSGAEFEYSLFDSYGGGCFVEGYSQAGAYVIAASGGHRHPDFTSAVAFDFEAAKWVRLDNAAGAPDNAVGFTRSECATNGEVTGYSQVPCPTHLYMNLLPLPPSLGGGPKGSVLTVVRLAISQDPFGVTQTSRFDLATRVWSRYSTNALGDVSDASRVLPESPSVFDSTKGRYFQLPFELHNVNAVPVLNAADRTWATTAAMPWPANLGANMGAFFDRDHELLVAQTTTGALRALDLNNAAAGWVTLQLNGTLPADANRWEYRPRDHAFYTYVGSGQQLHKLTPPSGNALTGAWSVTTVSVPEPLPANQSDNNTRHYTRFFFVPALDCFAWVADSTSDVFLINP